MPTQTEQTLLSLGWQWKFCPPLNTVLPLALQALYVSNGWLGLAAVWRHWCCWLIDQIGQRRPHCSGTSGQYEWCLFTEIEDGLGPLVTQCQPHGSNHANHLRLHQWKGSFISGALGPGLMPDPRRSVVCTYKARDTLIAGDTHCEHHCTRLAFLITEGETLFRGIGTVQQAL